ncbi:MMPL family transporter, partial [Paraburkholderia sp. BR14319]|uniref:MMPL family transporter n=1 Tax=Paraburkholderia sp. BR14319 TaxID=3237005 RepID=UPI0034D327F4
MLLALAAALYCAWRFAGPTPLQTNLLALLPATEADPVAEEAVDQLASALGNRAVLLVSSSDAAHAKAAAGQLGAVLSASHAFASVTAQVPPFDLGRITRFYLPYRFGLLTAQDRTTASGSTETLRGALAERLYGLPNAGLATSLADDPFGWLQHWLAGLPLAASNLTIEDGFLVAHRGNTTSVLVIGTLPGSAYESDVQRGVLLAVANGEAALKASWPDVTVARTGAVFYAESARRASERDVHVIGIVSAVGIALLMLWIFRSPRLILLGFVSTALGIVCALAATMLVFGKL